MYIKDTRINYINNVYEIDSIDIISNLLNTYISKYLNKYNKHRI